MFKDFPFSALSISLDQVAMVVNALPFASYVRTIQSNQYVLSNEKHAKQLGFVSPNEIQKVPYNDIVQHRRRCIADLHGNLELEEAYQRFIWEADVQVEMSKKTNRLQVCSLFPTGFVMTSIVNKIPIIDTNYRRVQAILTFEQDITSRFELVDTYALYRKHFNDGKQAIQQFIKYAELESYFKTMPTQQELLTLLMFQKDARAKYVARQLKLSDRTVEEYKSRLRSKMNEYMSLEQVLLKLRGAFNRQYAEEAVA